MLCRFVLVSSVVVLLSFSSDAVPVLTGEKDGETEHLTVPGELSIDDQFVENVLRDLGLEQAEKILKDMMKVGQISFLYRCFTNQLLFSALKYYFV